MHPLGDKRTVRRLFVLMFTGLVLHTWQPIRDDAVASALSSCMEETAIEELTLDPSLQVRGKTKGKKTKCLTTDEITSYAILDDRTVRFQLTGNRYADVLVQKACGDLKYHEYVSYVPMNGQLCAKVDELITREGIHCRIKAITVYSAR